MTPFFHSHNWTIASHLVGALAAGSLIGLERSFHGRAAGFRTNAVSTVVLPVFAPMPW